MKINNLTKGIVALSVVLVLGGGILAASAATTTQNNKMENGKGKGHGQGLNRPELTETQKVEMDAKQAAVKAALETRNYSAWVTAEKAINDNCPLLSKITADNFGKYAEAAKLRAQADSIMKDLGIDGPGMGGSHLGGFGKGEGRGK
ncbi:MAG: hypothetical protein WCJ57_03435 [Candidatus Falkowbacteria bacterium]